MTTDPVREAELRAARAEARAEALEEVAARKKQPASTEDRPLPGSRLRRGLEATDPTRKDT